LNARANGLSLAPYLAPYRTLWQVSEFRSAFLLRGIVVWGGFRLAILVLPSEPLTLSAKAFLILMVALAVWLDARRRGETLFLANLGIPSHAPVLSAVVLPASFEFLLL